MRNLFMLFLLLALYTVISSGTVQADQFDMEWNQSKAPDWLAGDFEGTVSTADKVVLADMPIEGNETRELGCDGAGCSNSTTFRDFLEGRELLSANLKIDVVKTDYDYDPPYVLRFVEYIKTDGEDMGQCTPDGWDCLAYHTCFDGDVTEKAADNSITVEIKNSDFVQWRCGSAPWVKLHLNWSETGYRTSGNYSSQIHDFGERVHPKAITAGVNLNSQSAVMTVYTSDDNFATEKDSETVNILGGVNTYQLENLSGRYAKVGFAFASDRSETPELNSFSLQARKESVWIEKIEPAVEVDGQMYTNQTNFKVYWSCSDPASVGNYHLQFRTYNGSLSGWSNWTVTDSASGVFGPDEPAEVKDGVEYHFRARVIDRQNQYWNWSGIESVKVDSNPPASNFYQPELYNYSFSLKWNHTDTGSGLNETETQVNISGVWKPIGDVCNISFTCSDDDSLCEGAANCSFPSERYKFRTRGRDKAGNPGEWKYITFTHCTDLDKDGFCWETGDCDDSNPNISPGANETCNGIDDNCDGKIDEGFFINGTGMGSPCGTGACEGVWVCNENGTGSYCNANHTQGELLEICENNIDDDCDGKVDETEEVVNSSTVKGCFCRDGDKKECGIETGECRKGEMTCVNGSWSECAGKVDPVLEICGDGKDNDCDGTIDEDIETVNGETALACVCQEGKKKVCGSNRGACKTGYRTCRNGKWSDCKGDIKPKEEVCNGIDDDCDGITDNIFGKNSVEETRCRCFDGGTAAKEVCNNIDDDCDGKIDEGAKCCSSGQTRRCINEQGVCSAGTQLCEDSTWGECSIKPGNEICGNNLDDDCDGETDEGCAQIDTTLYLVMIVIGIAVLFVTVVIESVSRRG
jgi:hypothetical protein